MSLNTIHITLENNHIGQLGGGAWLNSLAAWPVDEDTGELLLPLVSFEPAFFPVPQIPSDYMITVFVPAQPNGLLIGERRERMSHNSNEATLDPARLSTRMILHQKGSEELYPPAVKLLPKGYLSLEPMSDQELDQENKHSFNGLPVSKQMGRSHWLQEMIRISPRYHLLCQLNEQELGEFDASYQGILHRGLGYVFLDYRIKTLQDGDAAGFFFVQHS